MRYKLIDAEMAAVPVYRLCNFLTVSPSGYYVWRWPQPSQRQRDDMVHLAHIRTQFAMSNGTYETPRMPAELKEGVLAIGQHRTAHFMRDNGLKDRQKSRFKRTGQPSSKQSA